MLLELLDLKNGFQACGLEVGFGFSAHLRAPVPWLRVDPIRDYTQLGDRLYWRVLTLGLG